MPADNKTSIANLISPLHPEKKLGELSRKEMREILNRLPDAPEFHAGIVLLKSVLNDNPDEAKAVHDFTVFVDKADNILDNTGKILRHDFQAEPGESKDSPYVLGYESAMKKAQPVAGRRAFMRAGLRTMAWVGTGGVIAAYGAAKTGSQIAGYIGGKAETNPASEIRGRRDMFTLIHDFIGDHLMGPTDLVLGAAIFNEGLENWEDLKFEQISNGLSEFLQSVGAYENKSPPVKRTSRRNGRPR